MEETVCVVGVDWGQVQHSYAERSADGVESSGQFKSDPESVHEWVRQLRSRHREGMIMLGLEQSRGALIYALQRYDFIRLVPINPRSAKSYRDALYLSGAKDDPVDAQLIRDFVWKHRSTVRHWQPDDETTRKLRLLVEARRTLVGHRTSLTQALSDTLKQFFPHILTWFGESNSKLARAFLSQWPTLGAAKAARSKAIERVVRANTRKKPEQIAELITNIRAAVALTEDRAIVEAMGLLATSYVSMLDALDEPIRQYDDAIAALWTDHPDQELFSSFPGAGPVMAPRLAAAFGTDRARYQDASEMQKYSGIAPVMERSGKSSWTHARWRCPKFLRQSFHEFAAASIPFSAWAHAFYRQQRDRGAGHHAAIRSLAFRWIRILFNCWKKKISYDEKTHIENLRRRNSPVASRLAA